MYKRGRKLVMNEDIKQKLDTNSIPVDKKPLRDDSVPLFLKDGLEGKKGNDQDEKDETEE
jgi:hypothetical protein